MKPGPVLAFAAALLLLVAGSTMLLREMAAPARSLPLPATGGGAVSGNDPPGKWGLPAPEGAFNFHSAEAPDGSGSSSFSLKGRSADQVTAFYRRRMKSMGLLLLEARRVKHQVQIDAAAPARVISGMRATWDDPRAGRQVTLNVFDFPQPASDVQAVLNWRPHITSEEAGESGAGG